MLYPDGRMFRYNFEGWSDDSSFLFINGELTMSNPYLHGYDVAWDAVYLTAGYHSLVWYAVEYSGGFQADLLYWPESCPSCRMRIDNTVASPARDQDQLRWGVVVGYEDDDDEWVTVAGVGAGFASVAAGYGPVAEPMGVQMVLYGR